MGRQVLTGISPLAMQRCNALPENCYITDADVAEALPSGTLAGEMKVHHNDVAWVCSEFPFYINFRLSQICEVSSVR